MFVHLARRKPGHGAVMVLIYEGDILGGDGDF